MDQLAELTNNIYDGGFLKESVMDPSSMFLGLMVTMLPKLVPRIMPEIISRVSPTTKTSRFDDESYKYQMEEMFRKKFSDNLRMVVDILDEEKSGEVRQRSGEAGRLARLITTTLDTINVNIADFDGSKMSDLADIVSGASPRSAMYNMVADTILTVISSVASLLFNV